MIYSNKNIRRQDRLLEELPARILLETGKFGILSIYSEEEGVYGFPVNYVWDGNDAIYLHCAPEGRKLNIIKKSNQVSFCIVGKTNVLANKFTTEYESIILNGKAELNLPEKERMDALTLFINKYSPQFKEIGKNYAEKSFHRTEIIKLVISNWSGKCKKVTKDS